MKTFVLRRGPARGIRTGPLKKRIYLMKALHIDLHFIFFLLISASLFSAFGVLICLCCVFDTVKVVQMGISEFFFHPDVAEVLFLLNGLTELANHKNGFIT